MNLKINSGSQSKLGARPQTSPQKPAQGSPLLKKNKYPQYEQQRYMVSSGIASITKDGKHSKSQIIQSETKKSFSSTQYTIEEKKKSHQRQMSKCLEVRPNSRQQIQQLVRTKKPEPSNLLKYHEDLIQKQFSKLLELQKQHEQIKQNGRAMSNADIRGDLANRLMEYIKKQSSKKGYRSISNPDIMSDRKVVTKMAVKTQPGMLHTKQTKVNQDSYAIKENIAGIENSYLYQVSDGHGVNGHEVAQFVQEKLPFHLEAQMKHHKIGTQKEKEMDMMMQVVMRSAFERTTKELYQSQIDITFSGATTVVVIIIERNIWCANLGDSRAIIAKNNHQIVELSHDQKPDLPKEEKRIIQCGGRVQAYSDEEGNPVGPARVWLLEENIPGLAMSRSFGDYVAAQVGVISVPEVIKHTLLNDKFMVIASDGIWEFLDNKWVMEVVFEYYLKNDAEGAVDRLVREATKAWHQEDEVVDDITCIVVFLN